MLLENVSFFKTDFFEECVLYKKNTSANAFHVPGKELNAVSFISMTLRGSYVLGFSCTHVSHFEFYLQKYRELVVPGTFTQKKITM